MPMDSNDDIVIKIVILDGLGKTLEVQKQAWNVQDVTINALKKKVEGSSSVPREDKLDDNSWLAVDLSWVDKTGDKLRLQEGAELGLALKEMKGAGLTVAANAYLYHHFDEF